jgi:4-oxalocrotonate tautomerase
MPIINVKLVEGAFSPDQMRQLLPKLTDAVESVYLGPRDLTFVTIDEIKEGDWGIGGEAVTSEKVAAHAQKRKSRTAKLPGHAVIAPTGVPITEWSLASSPRLRGVALARRHGPSCH